MNKKTTFTIVVCTILFALVRFVSTDAQTATRDARFEFGMIKFDGPDQIQYIFPERFEHVRMFRAGRALPKNAHDEEYFLTIAANEVAKDGWEVINLDATRIMLRRLVR